MTPDAKWMYIKYRFDVHVHYKGVPPPPIEMWNENILDITSPEASPWFMRRDMLEMQHEMTSDSEG